MRAAPSLALALLAAGAAAAAEPPEPRRAQLSHLLEQDCGSCHGLTRKGGLGRPLLPEALAGKTDEALVHVILHGVPGTPMPPWRDELSRDDAAWIVRLLRDGVKP